MSSPHSPGDTAEGPFTPDTHNPTPAASSETVEQSHTLEPPLVSEIMRVSVQREPNHTEPHVSVILPERCLPPLMEQLSQFAVSNSLHLVTEEVTADVPPPEPHYNPERVTEVVDPSTGETLKVVTVENLRDFSASTKASKLLGRKIMNRLSSHAEQSPELRRMLYQVEDDTIFPGRTFMQTVGIRANSMHELHQQLLSRTLRVRALAKTAIDFLGAYNAGLIVGRED